MRLNILSFLLSLASVNAVSEWQSLSENVEFQPADVSQETPSAAAMLRSAQRRLSASQMVDGTETAYNEYATAWRLLGYYVDTYDDSVAEEERRRLGNNEAGRQRYLLWAAYVDLDYSGKGLGEYQIYNPSTKKWDKSGCEASGSKRCVKMDCHRAGTNFKLLGFFKNTDPVDFVQILAQHQGSCTWSDGEFNNMEDDLEWLPQACTMTEVAVGNSYLYFDLKPTRGGELDIGLYTEETCTTEYVGTDHTPSSVLSEYTGESIDVESSMSKWNEALAPFKVCQPCRTYDFGYVPSANEDRRLEEEADDNDDQNANEEEQEENANDDGGNDNNDDEEDPNHQYFICEDDDGNAGINQCAQFAQNTDIHKASFRDLNLASRQGTIVRTFTSSDSTESWWSAWGFLLISCLVFVLGLLAFCSVAVKRKKKISSTRNEPLLSQ